MNRRQLLLAGSTTLMAAPALGQSFSQRRITLMVGLGAGGMSDVTARILARKLEQLLGTNVIVENKVGAGGLLAINSVGLMEPDGHTLVTFLTDAPFTAAYQGRPIDQSKWAVIGGYLRQERVLFAAKSAPFATAQEMMEYARYNPISASDGGSFWSGRVIEAFARKHRLQIAVVPQRSGQAASTDVMGGHVTLAETGTGTPAWMAAKDGELKVLATLTPGGLAALGLPTIPTFRDLGADFVPRFYYGYAVRSATPSDLVAHLRAAFREAVEDPDVRAQMVKLDLTPKWLSPDDYTNTVGEVAADGDRLREYLKA